MSFLTAEWRRIFASLLLVAAVLVAALGVPAAAQEQRRGSYMPPAADAIHAIVAEHGMVVAQEKIAAHVGADVLKHGGNAVDAAVATGFSMAGRLPRGGHIRGRAFPLVPAAAPSAAVTVQYT